MYSVETATIQNKMYFAFNKVLESEKFLICKMTGRATKHHKQHQKTLQHSF